MLHFTFSSACFRVILLSMSLRFYMGLHSSGIPQGEGTEELFCLIEHFFYIRQHKEHFLQSLSRTEEKSPPAPVRKDKQRFQTWPARKLSISTLALLKERKFTFYQKGRFH